MNFDQLFEPALEAIHWKNRSPAPIETECREGRFPRCFDRRLQCETTLWCSNDYLGMGQHPSVIEAVHAALDRFGAGAGATPNVVGASPCHVLLEKELAELHGQEKALLFTSGYVANQAALSTLARHLCECIVFADAASHPSIIEGIRNSGAEAQFFRHNDPVDLEKRLANVDPWRPKLVCFEAVSSRHDDIAPIADICEVAERYGAMTYLDEADTVGLYGPRGGGISQQDGAMHRLTAIHGSLSRAFGVAGGYIVGSTRLINFVRALASGFSSTTPLPPALAAGALASVRHLKSSGAERDRQRELAASLRRRLIEAGMPVIRSADHIVSVPVGGVARCRIMTDDLLRRFGLYVRPVYDYDTAGAHRSARLRIIPTARHSERDIDRLISALVTVWTEGSLRRVA
ncbi:MAG TPA: 5-aminolevulinate synthase [Stellaceae bacterium]|nr:5-aminolevulinate synthase [Stellaceae bacterium]